MSYFNNNMVAVDFRYLLLEQYKKLGISEKDLAILLMTDHLILQGNDIITADLLSLKMNYKIEEIDASLASSFSREFLSYDEVNGKIKTSLEPLKKKLYKLFEMDMSKERANLYSAKRADALSNLSSYFESRLNRTLSPLELSTLSSWLDSNFSIEDIKGAFEFTLSQGKKSFKAIDKELRTYKRKVDIEKEGRSAISSTWDKDIEQTIEIAKTKWVKDD
ncbi:MAG TPA: hypothetical protein DEF61_04070 [Firmicutes bacterium]|nr:hypothetical protein [Bacillota bacterium]HBM70176.1 hypothetical protein [Bacillota bacterium]HBX25420.1 hypothetical protein [Bacillota bacterium]